MALRRIRSWRASASDMASGLLSHILVEPSMSVNMKVSVPVGRLATTTSMSFSLPLKDTIAAEHRLGPLFIRASEGDQPLHYKGFLKGWRSFRTDLDPPPCAHPCD